MFGQLYQYGSQSEVGLCSTFSFMRKTYFGIRVTYLYMTLKSNT